MKTSKRHFELTTMEHSACERVWDRTQEEVSAQRWKRKNRTAQLKRKIAKLTAQNEWLSAERKKYIEYYFNALIALAKKREELKRKKQK